ncbi:hypothetical protein [Flagellimonas sp. S3867]|uniref:hypothetical protein n=1 Tax=Flagellimonas sp. S3867 TaxID=2768063 RepID=UPI0016884CCC|nr:hypothetical protein [Flagellimonas sp. S3867]
MYIKIKLKPTKIYSKPIIFPILLPALQEAMTECYLGIGTPYEPIAIDNFVTIGNYVFPVLEPDSHITISLEPNSDDDKGMLKDPKLVCCMVKNVGKAFTDKNCKLQGYWDDIFDYKKEWVQNTPDGTLYIAPDKKKKCKISTKDVQLDDNVSYSIMFSMVLKEKKNKQRRYYFVLDPLVKISSGGGTGTP